MAKVNTRRFVIPYIKLSLTDTLQISGGKWLWQESLNQHMLNQMQPFSQTTLH